MIEVQGPTKRFGATVAGNRLSFRIERGDAFGFIGPNGAGKTTTIRMLATLLRPHGGTASINGYDIRKNLAGVRASVGYAPDFFGVYDGMKVWEYLDLLAAAYDVFFAERPRLIADVLELTDMADRREQYVDTLSRGQKRMLRFAGRIEEACAFLGTCPEARGVQVVNDHVTVVYCGEPGEEDRLLTRLVHRGFRVRSFTEEEMDLEDLYMGITRGGGG